MTIMAFSDVDVFMTCDTDDIHRPPFDFWVALFPRMLTVPVVIIQRLLATVDVYGE